MKPGAVLAALLPPHTEKEAIAALAARASPPSPWNSAAHFPRPGDGRAVRQANLAGYKAVIDAAASTAAPCR